MGIFPLPPPHVASVYMISVKSDPWVIPTPDIVDTWGKVMCYETSSRKDRKDRSVP